MNPNRESDLAAERELLRRLVDQRLTPEEFAAIEQRLLDDRAFRVRYVQYMDLESSLYEELTAAASASEAISGVERRPAAAWRTPRLLFWAALACSLAAAAAIAFRYWPAASGPAYVEIPLQGMEAVAVVTHAEGLDPQRKGAELKPGMRLKPGSMTLQQGQVQLEFLGGAKVLVQGPCELHVLSPKAATLVSGKAAARVLPWGRGFVLNTPEAVMVDLGTEFAVEVDKQQGSEVHVVDGEVEVSVLGEDGSTLTSERVEQANALRIRPGATTLQPNSSPEQPSLKVFDDPPRPLSVPDSYVRTIRQAKPTLYWRFQSLAGGLVPNEMGPQFAARVQLDSQASSAIRITDGRVDFSEAAGPRYLIASEPIPRLNAASFSIEFWVNPAMLQWATLVGIVPEGDAESAQHLNVIELAHRSSLVHEAGAFRFLHRPPPTKKGGMNLFTPMGCTPGQWHHLVAVKTPEELKLFLNGQLARRLTGEMGREDSAYQLHLGELRVSSTERQFLGSLDEVALYPYALSDAAIERHYRLLVIGSGE